MGRLTAAREGAILVIAPRIGTTRLIDNTSLSSVSSPLDAAPEAAGLRRVAQHP